MNFKKMLENKGINVAIRQPRGKNLKAGCGQLRANEILG
jgi:adenine C2-methylase RlmN of 23S rRNA A2503 and tRNA A37